MNALERMITEKGVVIGEDILKVDMFLNHQIDVNLIQQMGVDFYEHFKDRPITKVLTIEASGIAIACFTALLFDVPVVSAKRGTTKMWAAMSIPLRSTPLPRVFLMILRS